MNIETHDFDYTCIVHGEDEQKGLVYLSAYKKEKTFELFSLPSFMLRKQLEQKTLFVKIIHQNNKPDEWSKTAIKTLKTTERLINIFKPHLDKMVYNFKNTHWEYYEKTL